MNISFTRGGKGPYRLKKLSPVVYQIHVAAGPAYEGSKMDIIRMATALGLEIDELEIAVGEMRKLGHDIAEFGIGGKFMYTRLDPKRKAA